MKVAVTGPHGRLASWLIAHHGCIPLECDITDYDAVEAEIARIRPHSIINCAAYTKVDQAEKEREEALIVNTRGVGNVRIAFPGYMVHISTSYVFNGKLTGPYSEEAGPSPLNHYGWTKWGGEAAMFAGEGNKGLIVRTVSLYGPRSDDFAGQILRSLRENRACTLPIELISNPTYIPHLSKALMYCVRKQITGILNIAGTDILSRYEWALRIAKIFRLNKSLIQPELKHVAAAVRQRNASLDLSRAKSLKVPLYSLKRGLRELKRWGVQNNTSRRS